MQAVKVLPKGQITLPKEVRRKLEIQAGDTLLLEEKGGQLIIKKGKTIFDFIGILPKPELSFEKIRDKAVREAMKDHA